LITRINRGFLTKSDGIFYHFNVSYEDFRKKDMEAIADDYLKSISLHKY
jgi:hypothetical protein